MPGNCERASCAATRYVVDLSDSKRVRFFPAPAPSPLSLSSGVVDVEVDGVVEVDVLIL
jgi:hypothetical protein